jgi:hypothetical protein
MRVHRRDVFLRPCLILTCLVVDTPGGHRFRSSSFAPAVTDAPMIRFFRLRDRPRFCLLLTTPGPAILVSEGDLEP